MPNVLTSIANHVQAGGDGLYMGNCIHFRENSGNLWSSGSDMKDYAKQCRIEDIAYIIQPSSFWTRKVWEQTGALNENLHYAFDWEWFIRVKQNGFPFNPVPSTISLYRYHAEHKSGGRNPKRQHEVLSIYNRFSPRFAALYSKLIREKNDTDFGLNALFIRLYKTYCLFRKIPCSPAQALRKLKPNIYKEYTSQEISQAIAML
jgi:hypothetical protein